MILTTFPTRAGFAAGLSFLAERSLAYEIVEPARALGYVAVPALVMTREVAHELRQGAVARSSGFVEYRASSAAMPTGVAPEYAEDLFGRAAIIELTPCVADDTKIRLIAEISSNISPVLPYLNAVMTHASYDPAGDTLAFMEGYRMIVLYARRISAAKPDDIVDAWLTLERIRRHVNDTWACRSELEPSYVRRPQPQALQIYQLLPRTNCGKCGETTCMAFALRVSSGKLDPGLCHPLFETQHRGLLDRLRKLVPTMTVPVDS
jgi:ArsR family metal-binding transcriptional regulator